MQLSMILEERERKKEIGGNISWIEFSEDLNAAGPCVKSADEWFHWFHKYRERIQNKFRNGAFLSQIEHKLVLPGRLNR